MSPRSAPDADWERRFVAEGRRADEAAELYRRAGFEVRIDPAGPEDFDPGCESCWLVQSGLFRVIYTRRSGERA